MWVKADAKHFVVSERPECKRFDNLTPQLCSWCGDKTIFFCLSETMRYLG